MQHPAFYRPIPLLLLFSICLVGHSTSYAQGDAAKGKAIAQEAYDKDRGFGDFSADITLVITSNGKRLTRKLRTSTIETARGDRSISIFDEPRDVKGVARLTYSKEDGVDEQRMYLPDKKRVKRISSAQDSSPFMGTDFSFEDLGAQRPEEVGSFTYLFLREEACPSHDEQQEASLCFVIRRNPVNPNSGYSKQFAWIDQDQYRVQKIEYYDRNNALLKTLTYHDYRQYSGKYWRAQRFLMVNHQLRRQTEVLWSNYQFGKGLSPRKFTPSNLPRAR